MPQWIIITATALVIIVAVKMVVMTAAMVITTVVGVIHDGTVRATAGERRNGENRCPASWS